MNMMVELLVIFACLLASAFFSGSETALLRLRPHELEHDLRGQRGLAAMAAQQLIGSTSRLLVTILVGNNVVNIALGRPPQRGDRVQVEGYEIAVAVKSGGVPVDLRVRRLDEAEGGEVPPPGNSAT